VLVKRLSVTCADQAACSHLRRSGVSGIRRSTLGKSEYSAGMLNPFYTNKFRRRFATTSALAASSVPALLLARGHQISTVPEVPLVVSSEVFADGAIARTSAALSLLQSVGAGPDVSKVKASRKLRAGKGKLRGRRHRQRRGPLIVYNPEGDGKELVLAFRNIAGVETCPVFALNLLQLAPGGHLGRFIIWTSSAFKALDNIYGSTTHPSLLKKDFLLPSNVVTQADVGRLINSSEIQSVIRAAKGESKTKRASAQKKNPLHNRQVLLRLNPYAAAYSKEKLGTKGLGGGKPERAGDLFSKVLKED
jgi:large subunit ribosomal protein L4e